MFRPVCGVLLFLTAAIPAGAEVRVPGDAGEVRLSFAPVVRAATPAVVNIYAKRLVASSDSPFAGDPLFESFFRRFERPAARVQNSLGSGVIVDESGIVVSNYHVVANATDIRVVLTDRREFDGEIMLADEGADLAVIRLRDASGLPALEMADSESVRVGDLVLAIGNPFGVGQTVTSGIVSALGRGSMRGAEGGYLIQTDAAINPGNSGGALIDVDGKLLGINSSIVTRSGGSNGIGFAIPSALVRAMVTQARAGADRLWRPWLGIEGQPVDAETADALGMDLPQGVLVAQMHEESPLHAADVRTGDVILAVDGEPVFSTAEVEFQLMIRDRDRPATLTLMHDGKRTETSLRIAPTAVAEPDVGRVLGPDSIFAGTEVAALSPYWIEKLGLPVSTKGVVVTASDGQAMRGGLSPGDVVTRVNGTEVTTPDDLERLTEGGSGRWLVEIERQGHSLRLRVLR